MQKIITSVKVSMIHTLSIELEGGLLSDELSFVPRLAFGKNRDFLNKVHDTRSWDVTCR